MKSHSIIAAAALAILAAGCKQAETPVEPGLKDVFGDKFLIGAAINVNQSNGTDTLGVAAIKKHFNAIVAENCMKCEEIHPAEDKYFWDDADRFVKFGEENGMAITGHCLIWHSQMAPWFTKDSVGNLVDAETMKQRMKEHISTIMGRYKGRIRSWDVVNEAIEGDGSYRQSDFYKILGPEYIPLAFQYAHEADPDAELIINDYGMNSPAKRDAYVRIVNDMKKRGLRVDQIGMQSHTGMDYPDLKEYEESLKAFAGTGCKVAITEWDMSALPTINTGANISETEEYNKLLNPYPEALPDSVSKVWNARMDSVMSIFLRNADKIARVTAWGVSDGDSWKNDWPMKGRREYPLLLDRKYNLKPFLNKYIEEYKADKMK